MFPFSFFKTHTSRCDSQEPTQSSCCRVGSSGHIPLQPTLEPRGRNWGRAKWRQSEPMWWWPPSRSWIGFCRKRSCKQSLGTTWQHWANLKGGGSEGMAQQWQWSHSTYVYDMFMFWAHFLEDPWCMVLPSAKTAGNHCGQESFCHGLVGQSMQHNHRAHFSLESKVSLV